MKTRSECSKTPKNHFKPILNMNSLCETHLDSNKDGEPFLGYKYGANVYVVRGKHYILAKSERYTGNYRFFFATNKKFLEFPIRHNGAMIYSPRVFQGA